MIPLLMWTTLPLASLIAVTFITWLLASVPIYLAAKIVAGNKASIGKAMMAVVIGPIAFFLTMALLSVTLRLLLGALGSVLAFTLAFLMWLASYKTVFDVGWAEAFTIAVLSIAIFIVLIILLGMFFTVVVV